MLAATLAALATVGGAADASAARREASWTESFSRPLSGWTARGALRARRVRVRGERLLRLSATARGGGRISHRLGSRRWALSLDLSLGRATTVVLGLGDRRRALRLSRAPHGGLALRRPGGRTTAVRRSANPRAGGWAHLQAYSDGRAVHGELGDRRFRLRGRPGARLVVWVRRGGARLDNLVATSAKDPAMLLLHRLADLQSRVAPWEFLVGADGRDRLRLDRGSWTRGFLAGSLWQAAALTPRSDLYSRWALARAVATFGFERADSHDMGFVYEASSVAAYRRTCRAARLNARLCRRLRSSALTAAGNLVALADTNPGGGTIPTTRARPSPQESDTIVDSMMNLPLLHWATRVTGDQRYANVAAAHARRLASVLVRPDGSTAQSAHQDRQSGRVLGIHTHQGLSPTSTWARGQAWAIYGFTTSAAELRDRELLAVAERTAAWAAEHLPPTGIPPYDYDAPLGANGDTSAGVITAAGLLRLAALCRAWAGGCADPERWRPLGRRMLAAALGRVSRLLPLGFLGGQTGTYGGEPWDDQAELIVGLNYALEAVNLGRR
jgi:hypothetical protein